MFVPSARPSSPALLVSALLIGCGTHAPLTMRTGQHHRLHSRFAADIATELGSAVDRYVEEFSRFLAVDVPTAPLDVRVVDSQGQLNDIARRHCPRLKGRNAVCCETGNGFVVAVAHGELDEKTLTLLRHELFHYVLGSSYYDIPAWVDEGLAQHMEGSDWRSRAHRSRRSSLRRRGKIDLEGLVSFPAGKKLSRRQYAEAWSVVHYLLAERDGGREQILCYLEEVRSGSGTGAGFEGCFGLSPAELEPRRRRYFEALFDRRGGG